MKKILSVALSTAMAFSMFASVAFGQTGLTDVNAQYNYLKDKGIFAGFPDGQAHLDRQMTRAEFAKVITKTMGLKEVEGVYSFKDKNYGEKHWAAPYVEAVYAAGIMEGVNSTKKIFGTSNPVTIQEMATVLVRALDLEVPTETNNSATAWAKGYVQAAINAGLVDANANFQSNASRELLVSAAYAVDQELSLQVESYTVIESGKAVEFKMSDGETVKVTLDKALVANTETEVKFTHKDKEFTEKVTYVVTTATKVASAVSANLKEVDVQFDGTVDKVSAEDKDKYSVDSSVTVQSATLLEDGKTVRLTVAGTLTNQRAYKLDVRNVKAGDRTIDAEDVAFTPIDNALPEVSEVKALGTKAIKVTFSEPIKTASSANFKLDGKTFFGSVDTGSRELILKPYTASDLSVGNHKLEVSGVEDYNNFKALTKEFDFTVVEDTTAPTVANVSATLEKVTVTFSEEIDQDTLSASNVYWKSGNDKKAASSINRVSATVYEFDFTANSLPGYETSLFVEGVKDYSGNQIKDTEVKVRAELDQTRPEVTEVRISQLNNKEVNLKFSKQVKIEDVKYFTLTKANGDVVPVRTVASTDTSDPTVGKVFTLTTYDALDESYTLKISGVRDTTKLQNTIVDYTTTLNGSDVTAPSYTSNSGTGRTLIINFDKKLELASLGSAGNYLVTINDRVQQLPAGTEVTPIQNGEAVRLVFPEYIDNARVGINDTTAGANVTHFQLLGLKDAAGNVITNFGAGAISINSGSANLADGYDNSTSEPAKLTAKGEIKVKFDQPIGRAAVSDFALTGSATGVSISSVTANGSNIVTVKLSGDVSNTALTNTDDEPFGLVIRANNNIVSTSGIKAVQTETQVDIKDAVKPQVQLASGQTRLNVNSNVIILPFSEALGGTATDYKYDLVVTNIRTQERVPVTSYTTGLSADEKNIEISLTAATTDEYSVRVINDAAHIQDKATNKAAVSSTYNTAVGAIDTVAPTVTKALTGNIAHGATATITFSESINAASQTAVESAIVTASGLTAADLAFTWNGATVTVANNSTATDTAFTADVTVNITDLKGNPTTGAKIVDVAE